ncbi:MAG: hypothetical protein J6P70_05200 [Ruminobacter sp.]|nr:hypothetical protein [Ruminobacter sp.]
MVIVVYRKSYLPHLNKNYKIDYDGVREFPDIENECIEEAIVIYQNVPVIFVCKLSRK